MSESQIDNTEKPKIKKTLSDEERRIKQEKAALYREQNKELLIEYRKAYYQENKERWASQNILLICAICNNKYKKCHVKRHSKTRKHQECLIKNSATN